MSRRLLVLLTVAVLLTVGVLVRTRSGGDHHEATGSPLRERGSWRALPDPPLSPRAGAIGVWTGREVIFLGGESKPCPPYITCDNPQTPASAAVTYGEQTDGAAYDVKTGAWRRLKPPPTRLPLDDAVYAGGHVLFTDLRGHEWDYEVADDSWSRFRPRWDARSGVSAVGDRFYGLSTYDEPGGRVVSYDPRKATWSRYPVDRLRPRLTGYPEATSKGPVLVGHFASRHAYHHLPTTMVVDVWSGHAWRRLPLTPQLDQGPVWTGRRLADPVQGTRYHAGADPWPHRYPEGGDLDPATGRWTPLPALWQAAEVRFDRPAGWDVDTGRGVPEPRFVVGGSVYDDDTGTAWLLPRPDGSPEFFASGVWAGDRLVVLGGANFDGQHQTGVSRRAWIYRP